MSTPAQLAQYCADHFPPKAGVESHWYMTDFNWLKWTCIAVAVGVAYLFIRDVVPLLWSDAKSVVSTSVAGVEAGATKIETKVESVV